MLIPKSFNHLLDCPFRKYRFLNSIRSVSNGFFVLKQRSMLARVSQCHHGGDVSDIHPKWTSVLSVCIGISYQTERRNRDASYRRGSYVAYILYDHVCTFVYRVYVLRIRKKNTQRESERERARIRRVASISAIPLAQSCSQFYSC